MLFKKLRSAEQALLRHVWCLRANSKSSSPKFLGELAPDPPGEFQPCWLHLSFHVMSDRLHDVELWSHLVRPSVAVFLVAQEDFFFLFTISTLSLSDADKLKNAHGQFSLFI